MKKLHPDVLRSRFRTFRRFVISAGAEKRYSNSEPSGSSLNISKLPHDCDASMNPQSANPSSENAPENVPARDTNTAENYIEKTCDEKRQKYVKSKLKLENMDTPRVPDVVVRKNSINSQNNDNQQNSDTSPSSTNQLAINVDSSPRNKSPITVQEWVDALPLTPNETSR